MSERRVVPDVGHPLNMGETELFISGIFDSLHYWQPLDAYWIRYFDGEDNSMKMIILKEELARMIIEQTDVPFVERNVIFEREHKALVDTLGKWATDELFQIDIDTDTIVAEESKEDES